MKKRFRLFGSLGLVVMLTVVSDLAAAASDTAATSNQDKVIPSTVVIYQDAEKGIEPYITRYIINKKFMRIDDGKPNTGYVLLDRKKDVIYSVSVENESILLIAKNVMKMKPPAKVSMQVFIVKEPSKIKLEGKQAHEFQVVVEGKTCRNNITVDGVLPEFVSALKQYRSILANQHAQNLFKTPVNMRDKCFMSYHIYHHGLHTSRGLVLRSWDNKGKRSTLHDYKKDQKASKKLFTLPKKYSQFKAGQVPVP